MRQTIRNGFVVIQPTLNRSDPAWINSGRTISQHRTREAAERYIQRANRSLRLQVGQANSWYDWHIVEVKDGERI